jgi:hypothetical protein
MVGEGVTVGVLVGVGVAVGVGVDVGVGVAVAAAKTFQELDGPTVRSANAVATNATAIKAAAPAMRTSVRRVMLVPAPSSVSIA